MIPLTTRQRQIFEYVCATIRVKGCAPSLAEIGQAFGLSSLATVSKHMANLQEKGYVHRRWNHSRAVTILRQSDDCPCCGQKWPS